MRPPTRLGRDRPGTANLPTIESSITLDQGAASSKVARDFVTDFMDDRVATDVLEIVVLLTSEVVTNAVLHAQTKAQLTVRVLSDAVRIEVADGEARVPVRRRAAAHDTSGRGIHLVDVLSSRWGVEPSDRGKLVWFEVDR